MIKKILAVLLILAVIGVGAIYALLQGMFDPTPQPAAELEVIEEIALEWPVQCFDADHLYENVDQDVHCGAEYDNMTIEIEDEQITLTHAPDPDYMEGEYRNVFLLSQPMTIPDNGDMLVVRGRMDIDNIQGSTGIWLHLAELFASDGSILSNGGGFAGGAAGSTLAGSLSAGIQQGWRVSQVDGWDPVLQCFIAQSGLKNGDMFEMRVTRERTQFVLNDQQIGDCKTRFDEPELMIQLWVDNLVGKTFFDVAFEATDVVQTSVYSELSAFIAREK